MDDRLDQRYMIRGTIMTMDISYAMLFLLWLVIVAVVVYGVWKVIDSRGR